MAFGDSSVGLDRACERLRVSLAGRFDFAGALPRFEDETFFFVFEDVEDLRFDFFAVFRVVAITILLFED